MAMSPARINVVALCALAFAAAGGGVQAQQVRARAVDGPDAFASQATSVGATTPHRTLQWDAKKGRWGLSLGDLNSGLRGQLQIPSQVQGAVVEDVQPGSPADNAGLQRGDVIVEVNRHPQPSAADAAQALSNISKGEDALVLVWSNGGNTFRVLHPTQE